MNATNGICGDLATGNGNWMTFDCDAVEGAECDDIVESC
jgi:hypothetical protein